MMTFKSKWTPEDKIRIVLESLNTNISLAELCRRNNLTPATFYQWRERFIEAGKAGLSGQLNDGVNKNLERENERLKKLIGELTIANDSFTHVRFDMAMLYAFFDSNLGRNFVLPITEE